MANNTISLGSFDDSSFDFITDANIASPAASNVIDLSSMFGSRASIPTLKVGGFAPVI